MIEKNIIKKYIINEIRELLKTCHRWYCESEVRDVDYIQAGYYDIGLGLQKLFQEVRATYFFEPDREDYNFVNKWSIDRREKRNAQEKKVEEVVEK